MVLNNDDMLDGMDYLKAAHKKYPTSYTENWEDKHSAFCEGINWYIEQNEEAEEIWELQRKVESLEEELEEKEADIDDLKDEIKELQEELDKYDIRDKNDQ